MIPSTSSTSSTPFSHITLILDPTDNASSHFSRCPGRRRALRAHMASARRLKRVGIQLYSLRDDARRELERTIANIAGIGYKDIELLGSMNNFGMPPARLRAVLDAERAAAPSTHVSGNALADLDRQLDDALTLGHEYLTVASLPDRRHAHRR